MAGLRLAALGVGLSVFLVLASAAAALTLGSTTQPSGSSAASCSPGTIFWQSFTDSSYDYAVPTGGGLITSWSTDTTLNDTPGTMLSLVVLRPSGPAYTVVGADRETLPTPLPAGGVATFDVAQPIAVGAGDVLGLYSPTAAIGCAFSGAPISPFELVSEAIAPTAWTVGSQITPSATTASAALINVSANLDQTEDVALSGAASPASIPLGGAAAYAFTVSNGGLNTGPITFTDAVPGGLSILSAAASSGTCSVAGQTVTCTIVGLAAGSTTPVLIIVSPSGGAGTYSDTATIASSFNDATPADNTAGASLVVTAPSAPPAPLCHVVSLTGVPLAVAKAVLSDLNCTVGKVTKRPSNKVAKGLVISASPGSRATLANGTKVSIVVSSGPPKKKKHRRK